MSFRTLEPAKLIETMDELEQRIAQRFPGAGLVRLAGGLGQVVREAVQTVERIRRPNLGLRVGVGILVAGLVAFLAYLALALRLRPDSLSELPNVVHFTDSALTSIVFLAAGIGFLVTLEARLKRRRTLGALHELRALAHIVDMHQLRKDPDVFLDGKESDLMAGSVALTPVTMVHYLQYCAELLALVSKIAALYVQDFPDAVAVEAADRVESLTTALSGKIWQKIGLLERVQRSVAPAGAR